MFILSIVFDELYSCLSNSEWHIMHDGYSVLVPLWYTHIIDRFEDMFIVSHRRSIYF